MGQVPALGQVHTQDGVAQFQQAEVDRQVGLGAGMGLHVGVFRAEQLAGPVDGQLLHLIHPDAAAVVPVGGIALGVLVGEHAAHSGHHRRADDVLAGDQLDVFPLTGELPVHGGGHFRVALGHKADGVNHILEHSSHPLSVIMSGRARDCFYYTAPGSRKTRPPLPACPEAW